MDADYNNDLEDRRSRSGILVYLGNSPIIWASRKQHCNVISTTEAEYVALALCAQEVRWARQLLEELGHPSPSPTPISEDNRGCWYLAVTGASNPRTKHIDIRHHFIRDYIAKGICNVIQCGSMQQLADIFTKGVDPEQFNRCRTALRLVSNVARGGIGSDA